MEVRSHANILLITQGLDGIKLGGARGRVEAGNEADENRKADAEKCKPQGNRRNIHARKILTMQVEISAERKRAANEPAK